MFFTTPFQKAINDLFDVGEKIQDDRYQAQREICCPKCKTGLTEFLDTGFVGCAECYNAFSNHTRQFAIDVHGRASHVGKVPQKEATRAMKKRELERLIKEKELAVKEENYILADELKAKITRLKGEI